jgi:hypothetical protein
MLEDRVDQNQSSQEIITRPCCKEARKKIAELEAIIEKQNVIIAKLMARIEELERRLGLNSNNN